MKPFAFQRTQNLAAGEQTLKTASLTMKDRVMVGLAVPRMMMCSGIAVRLFLTCWLIYVLHFATNTVREIYPALSLGDHLSFDVSEYVGFHSDIFEIPGRGAFINNNPGASIMGAIPYLLTRPVLDRVVQGVQATRANSPIQDASYNTIYELSREFYRKARARGLDIKFGLAAGVMQALLMAPLSALSVVVMYWLLVSLTGSAQRAVWLALLYAFATPVFFRTAQLNHNLLGSHFALFAFALLWQPWNRQKEPTLWTYLVAGLLAGWTLVLDYSGVVIIAMVGLYVLTRQTTGPFSAHFWRNVGAFGGGIVVCGVILMGYQWSMFGHPLYPAQHYMPVTRFSHFGYQGMDWPQLDLIWALTFGIRYGLFTSAPLLLLVFLIPVWVQRRTRFLGAREIWFIALFTLAFLAFTAANQFSRMQFNTGIRHIVPVVPFLFLLVANVLLRMPTILAVLFGIVTTYWSWCLAMYRDVEQGYGIFDSLIYITLGGFRLPWLTALEQMGYLPDGASALPLLMLCGLVVAALWWFEFPALAPRGAKSAIGANAVPSSTSIGNEGKSKVQK